MSKRFSTSRVSRCDSSTSVCRESRSATDALSSKPDAVPDIVASGVRKSCDTEANSELRKLFRFDLYLGARALVTWIGSRSIDNAIKLPHVSSSLDLIWIKKPALHPSEPPRGHQQFPVTRQEARSKAVAFGSVSVPAPAVFPLVATHCATTVFTAPDR